MINVKKILIKVNKSQRVTTTRYTLEGCINKLIIAIIDWTRYVILDNRTRVIFAIFLIKKTLLNLQ